jgi:Zinc carboxypeptidase
LKNRILVFFCLAIGISVLGRAQSIAPDTAVPGSVDEIAKDTTEPRFLSPWVSYIPASTTVPSPEKFFGRIFGAPGELVNSAQAYAYSRALAAASPRVKVFTIGRSEEGRDIILLAIADEKGIQDLDTLKAENAKLADPRTIDAATAEQLVGESRPFYYFNATVHSDETGSTESVLELAYRLAVSDQPMIRRIRENMVVLINPVSNPDGRDKQVEWFYRFLKGKTDRDTLPRQSSPYWSKYAMVDINRDAHQLVHETTKAVSRMFFEYHPVIVHDLHESVALLMTWNGTGPYNPNIDPITYSEFLTLSFHEVETMTGFGMPGVWTWNFGEAFGHMFMDSVAMNHNAIGRGYETFGNGTAETLVQSLSPEETSAEWYRVLPPPTGRFSWSARDNVNYNETGALAALDYSAKNSHMLLRNFYTKSLHSWRKGLEEAPYAFIIPEDQGDPARVADMITRLQAQHIEVSRSDAPLAVKEGSFPAGTYVVRLDQPYRNYAVDLLTPQNYPKDGGEPYDDVSWEFPAYYHLQAIATADASIRDAKLTLLTSVPHARGQVTGEGPVYLLKDSGQEGFLEARYRLAAFKVQIAERSFVLDNVAYPAGSWIFPAQAGVREALREVADRQGLEFTSAAALPQVRTHVAKVPRLGLWVPWADTDSIGWVRYTLDQRKIPYIYLRDEDIRTGGLQKKIDVLLYGHVDLELAEQIHGIPKEWGPMPFKRTPKTPSHGTPAASDDITGGIGWEGLGQIQQFVEHGGLMVTLGNGTMLALEGGIVRGVRRDSGGVPRSTQGGGAESSEASHDAVTRTPGSEVRVNFVRPDHPIAYGYPQSSYVFRSNFALYSVPRRWLRMGYCETCLDGPFDARSVVLQWGDPQNPAPFLVSGQVWGESNLIGRPAILDTPVGLGHVVAFNFNPLYRDMNRGDQRMLWNTIINWQAILQGSPGRPAATD